MPAEKIILSILVSFIVTALLFKPVNKIGKKFNIIDKPTSRKKISTGIVRIGGLSLFFGLLISTVIFSIFGWYNIYENNLILYSLSASFCVFLIGLVDDIKSISPFPRLFLQIIVSTIFWKNSIQINSIDLSLIPFLDKYDLPQILSLLFTVIVIVGIINAFNWQDGLDGLASGVAFFTSIGYALVLIALPNIGNEIFYIFSFAGVCLGFLVHNRNPANILMGDCGSYFLGFNLSIFAINTYSKLLESDLSKYSFFITALILFVPIADMAFVIISRLWERRSPFFPDIRHFHYKLMKLGISHRETVILCCLINQLIISFILSLAFIQFNFLFPISFSVFIFFVFSRLKKINKWYGNYLKKLK